MKKGIISILLLSFALVSCTTTKNNKNEEIIETPGETEDSGENNSGDDGGNNSSGVESLELSYKEKLNRNMFGVSDTNFTNYFKNLSEYKNDESISEKAIFASPNGNGDGSITSPFSLSDALDEVKAGETLYLREGIYDSNEMDGYFLNKSGTSNNYITIRNYPCEEVIITNSYIGSEAYGFQVDPSTSYFILEGITINNISSKCAYGIVFWGDNQNNIIIRNCDINNIKTTSLNPEKDSDCGSNGILLFGEGKNPIYNVLIMNNKVHNNVNGWSENISVTANCENVYVISNDVYDNTNIGIDFYGNNSDGYCSIPSLNQPRFCLASGNTVKSSKCSYADCAGLYVDGSRDIILQNNYLSDSQYGIEVGSEEKNDDYLVKNIMVRNNIITNNSITGIRIGGYETTTTGVVTDTFVYNNTLINNGDGSDSAEIILAKCKNIKIYNNVIKAKRNIILTDFNSDYIKEITFTNNLLYVENALESNLEIEYLGNQILGMSNICDLFGINYFFNITFDNLYVPTNYDATNYSLVSNDLIYDYYLKDRRNLTIGAVSI